jgi:hypothetical protein
MISVNSYHKDDLLLIKGHILAFVLCLLLIGGIFWTVRYIDNSAEAELQQARSQIDSVRSSMDRIQSAEEVAKQYIDQYQRLQMNGVVGEEDRLHLLELLSQIRAEHQLFPVSINIHEQAELALPSENNADGSGQPVKLRSSVLDISFPLLHEEDLSRLLGELLRSSWFLQPASCQIDNNNKGNTTYYYLGKHFSASCSLYWYTFNVAPAAEVQP